MSTCSVCAHPELDVIDAALQQGVSLRMLEQTYHISRSTLSRHQSHTTEAGSPPVAEPVSPLPKTRLRHCEVCQLPDPQFATVEAALSASEPSQSLAQAHHVALSALTLHFQHRASEAIARRRWEADQQQPAPVDDPRDPTYRHSPVQRALGSLVEEAERVQQQALRARGLETVLFTLREMAGLLVKMAQGVTGEER